MPRTKRKGRKCTAAGCDGKHLARGLCVVHYSEAKRREKGVPERGEAKPHELAFMVPTTLRDRFFSLVPDGTRSEFMREALEQELERLEGATAAR